MWDRVEDLKKKVAILNALKAMGFAKCGIFLLDNGVCRRSEHLCNEIKRVLSSAKKSLMVLSYHVLYEDLLTILNRHLS